MASEMQTRTASCPGSRPSCDGQDGRPGVSQRWAMVTGVEVHMREVPGSPEDRFDALVDELVGIAGVTPPGATRGFGAHALRVHTRIFAMLVRGRLVVKLPKARVDALVAAGEGARFDAGKGTPMREWLSLDPASDLPWSPLAREALDFVEQR
jgi:hypothetical protein